jgi:glucose-1-phosphate adenylyltransferase
MGIYIFNRSVLEDYLVADENDKSSSNDFGKNIIPNMLADGKMMFAYPFEGYWKDVGTIDSLWEANMDLLGENPNFNVHDKSWRIFSRNYAEPPQFIGNGGYAINSIITEGCVIEGMVKNSVLSNGVVVEEGAIVSDSVIMSGVTVKAGARVNYSIIDSNTVVGEKAVIGENKEVAKGITVIGSDITIGGGSLVEAGVMIDSDFNNGNN